jgi:two-component system, chemotaxis family, protein-glutamate methylesterase/glutaminase
MNTLVENADKLIQHDLAEQERGKRGNKTSTFTCPDCSGTLWQIDDDGSVVLFQCHVGHKYSADALLLGMGETIENALWTAVRAMTERAIFTRQLASGMRRTDGDAEQGADLEGQAARDEEGIKLIRSAFFKRYG